MALLVAADFRTATLSEVCSGLALTTAEAADALLTAAIARLTTRLEQFANDAFESESLTLDLDGEGSSKLLLPKRCTAVSAVSLRDQDGTLTAQTSTIYRLHSSLYSTGSKRQGELDWLEVVPNSSGLTGYPSGWDDPWRWPVGPQTVRVAGTFGWTTAPGDIKRALALMVWDHFKPLRNDLRRASRYATNDISVEMVQPDPGNGVFTGIPEADYLIGLYRRDSYLAVG